MRVLCISRQPPPHRDVLEETGGGGSGTQKCVYQRLPDQIFPIVHFVSSPAMVTLVGRDWGGGGGSSYGVRPFQYFPPPPPRPIAMVCVCARECGPEAPDVTPTRVPKECGYGNFTRRSRTGSVVVCVAPSPARSSLWHKPLTHRVGLATCLAGVGHTPIPPPPPRPIAAPRFMGRSHWCGAGPCTAPTPPGRSATTRAAAPRTPPGGRRGPGGPARPPSPSPSAPGARRRGACRSAGAGGRARPSPAARAGGRLRGGGRSGA